MVKRIEFLRQRRSKKDKDAPKRPISAYFFYNQERRETAFDIFDKNNTGLISTKDIIKIKGGENDVLHGDGSGYSGGAGDYKLVPALLYCIPE